jgi:hypothetical protein
MKHLVVILLATVALLPACSSDGKSGDDETDTGIGSDGIPTPGTSAL